MNELSNKFGNQCIVVAIDAKQIDSQWKVHLAGGTIPTELDLFEWAKDVITSYSIHYTKLYDGSKIVKI